MKKKAFWKKVMWLGIFIVVLWALAMVIIIVIKTQLYGVQWNVEIGNGINWGIGLGASLIVCFLFWLNYGKKMKFVEDSKEQIHGNAKFLIDERKHAISKETRKKFDEEYPDKQVPCFVARIFNENNQLKFNTILDEHHKKAVHTLVLGATGAGKTQRFVFPTLYYNMKLNYENKPNIFVTDVKGEIAEKFRDEFKKNGYDVIEINLSNPFNSNRWNPLNKVYQQWKEYLGLSDFSSEEASKLKTDIDAEINNIIEPFFPNKSGDNAEWVIGGQSIAKGVIWYLLEFCWNEMSEPQFNLPSVKSLISTQQSALMQDLLKCKEMNENAKCFNYLNAYFVECASEKQRSGYVGTVVTGLNIFDNDGIKYLTSANEINFLKFLSADNHDENAKPVIIFFIVPDEDTTRYAMATMFINQFYNTATKVSRTFASQALPRTLLFVGDEFFNMPKVPDMQQKIAVARSRNIFFGLIAQSESQIEKVYREDKDTIKNNCPCHVILAISNNDLKYADDLAKQIGQKTILSKSFSKSLGNQGKNGGNDKGSMSESLQSLNLINANEILALQAPLGILLKNKIPPSIVNYYASFEFPEINEIHAISRGPKYQVYDENEIMYLIKSRYTEKDLNEQIKYLERKNGISKEQIMEENSQGLNYLNELLKKHK